MNQTNLATFLFTISTVITIGTQSFGKVEAKDLTAASSARPTDAAQENRIVLKRTGPFVKLLQSSADNGWQAKAENGQIIFSGPNWKDGKEVIVSATVNFNTPPEHMSPGDKFTLEASVVGDEAACPTGYIAVDGSWTMPPKSSNSQHLSGAPENKVLHISDTYTVVDAQERIKQFKTISQEAFTPVMEEQVLNSLPVTKLYVDSHGASAEVTFKYTR